MIKYSRSPYGKPMLSYAQNGEDVLIDRVFQQEKGFFVDVGASHPVYESVTKHLSNLGWRGINIEPDSETYAALVNDRPKDINLHCAVGKSPGVVTFHRLPNRYMSTTNEAHLDALGARVRSLSMPEQVQMRSLAGIVAEFVDGVVDLLKIDAEGSEQEVIEGADWDACRPRLLVVEATRPWSAEPTWGAWEPVLLAHGYLLAFFDGVNRYYLRDEDRALIGQFAVPVNVFDHYRTLRFDELETRALALEAELEALKSGRVPQGS